MIILILIYVAMSGSPLHPSYDQFSDTPLRRVICPHAEVSAEIHARIQMCIRPCSPKPYTQQWSPNGRPQMNFILPADQKFIFKPLLFMVN